MEYAGFVGPSNPSAAYTADQERTVNFYFEQMEIAAATSRFALYPTPGLELILAGPLELITGGGGRAHFGQDDREFCVIGNKFIEILSTGSPVVRGTVEDDGLPATIDSNGKGGDQLFICSGNNGYIYGLTSNFFGIVLTNQARMGAQLDGYFLALDVATSTFYFSALLDGISWSTGLDFAQRSGSGDPWVAMKVCRSYIYLLGEQTSEVWYDTGASFPFARHPSGQLQVGCAAPFSATVVNGNLMFLGATSSSRGSVQMVSGFTPQRVSSFAFETAIAPYGTIADAQGDTYYQHGHSFYYLSFPDEDKASWLWNSSNGLWTEQGTWDQDNASDFVAWRPRWTAQIFGETRILHAESPRLYRLTAESPFDSDPNGRDPIQTRRLRRAPAMVNELERIYYPEFEIDLQPATANTTAPGDDPQVMMRQSKDGGRNWTSERWASSGKVGEYGIRVIWWRCGMGRRMVFEVSFSDGVPWRITNAYLPGVKLSRGRQLAKAS